MTGAGLRTACQHESARNGIEAQRTRCKADGMAPTQTLVALGCGEDRAEARWKCTL